MAKPTSPLPERLPQELWSHLPDLPPKSYEFQKEIRALNELAGETGYAALSMEDIFPPVELETPEGYNDRLLISHGVDFPTDQFQGVIYSLQTREASFTTDVERLTTDTSKELQLCDLRPFMTSSVRDGGPVEKGERDQLDRAVYRDIKFLVDMGRPLNSVKDVAGVNYTRLGDKKIRAYWMAIHHNSGGDGPMIARIADCRDSVAAEADLYRRVFNKKLQK